MNSQRNDDNISIRAALNSNTPYCKNNDVLTLKNNVIKLEQPLVSPCNDVDILSSATPNSDDSSVNKEDLQILLNILSPEKQVAGKSPKDQISSGMEVKLQRRGCVRKTLTCHTCGSIFDSFMLLNRHLLCHKQKEAIEQDVVGLLPTQPVASKVKSVNGKTLTDTKSNSHKKKTAVRKNRGTAQLQVPCPMCNCSFANQKQFIHHMFHYHGFQPVPDVKVGVHIVQEFLRKQSGEHSVPKYGDNLKTVPLEASALGVVTNNEMVLPSDTVPQEDKKCNSPLPKPVGFQDMKNVLVIEPQPPPPPQQPPPKQQKGAKRRGYSVKCTPGTQPALPTQTSRLRQPTKTQGPVVRQRRRKDTLKPRSTNDNMEFPTVAEESDITTDTSDSESCSLEPVISNTKVNYIDGGREPDGETVCPFCGKKLKYGEGLTRHLVSHQRKKPHRCTLCDAGFSCQQGLEFHLMSQLPKKAQKPRLGKRKRKRGIREEWMDEWGRCKCLVCGKRVPDFCQLSEHLTQHQVDQGHRCRSCIEGFSNVKDLIDHLMKRLTVKGANRRQARKAAKHETKLKPENHIMKSLTDKETNTRQEEIQPVTPETDVKSEKPGGHSAEVKTNQPSHQGRSLESEGSQSSPIFYPCRYCSSTIASTNYIQHLSTHVESLNFHCQACGEKFMRTTDVNKHVRVCRKGRPDGLFCRSIYDPLIECGLCGKRFEAFPAARRHHEIIHAGLIPVLCTKCGIEFSTLRALNVHLIVKHNDDKVHKCGVCFENLYGREALARHDQLLHSEENKVIPPAEVKEDKGAMVESKVCQGFEVLAPRDTRFKCVYCTEVFNSNVLYVRHLYEIHKPNESSLSD